MPALVTVVLLAIVLAAITGPRTNVPIGGAASLLFLNDFVTATGRFSGWLDQTWSLGVEEQFYLVWPFALAFLLRYGRRGAGRACVAIAAITMVVATGVGLHVTTTLWAYFTPIGSVAPLLLGAAAALLGTRLPGWVGLGAIVALLGCYLLGPQNIPNTALWQGWQQATGIAAAALIAWLAHTTRPGLFAWSPVVWLGRRSYGLYLIHQVVNVFLESTLATPTPTDRFLLGVPLSLLLTAGMYRLVETPFLRRKREPAWRGPVVAQQP